MSYVDAGYAVALSVLACYGAGLLLRRRRLTKALARPALPPGGGQGAGRPDPGS